MDDYFFFDSDVFQTFGDSKQFHPFEPHLDRPSDDNNATSSFDEHKLFQLIGKQDIPGLTEFLSLYDGTYDLDSISIPLVQLSQYLSSQPVPKPHQTSAIKPPPSQYASLHVSPLMVASILGSTDCIDLLIKFHASVDIVTTDGLNSLAIAIIFNQYYIFCYLITTCRATLSPTQLHRSTGFNLLFFLVENYVQLSIPPTYLHLIENAVQFPMSYTSSITSTMIDQRLITDSSTIDVEVQQSSTSQAVDVTPHKALAGLQPHPTTPLLTSKGDVPFFSPLSPIRPLPRLSPASSTTKCIATATEAQIHMSSPFQSTSSNKSQILQQEQQQRLDYASSALQLLSILIVNIPPRNTAFNGDNILSYAQSLVTKTIEAMYKLKIDRQKAQADSQLSSPQHNQQQPHQPIISPQIIRYFENVLFQLQVTLQHNSNPHFKLLLALFSNKPVASILQHVDSPLNDTFPHGSVLLTCLALHRFDVILHLLLFHGDKIFTALKYVGPFNRKAHLPSSNLTPHNHLALSLPIINLPHLHIVSNTTTPSPSLDETLHCIIPQFSHKSFHLHLIDAYLNNELPYDTLARLIVAIHNVSPIQLFQKPQPSDPATSSSDNNTNNSVESSNQATPFHSLPLAQSMIVPTHSLIVIPNTNTNVSNSGTLTPTPSTPPQPSQQHSNSPEQVLSALIRDDICDSYALRLLHNHNSFFSSRFAELLPKQSTASPSSSSSVYELLKQRIAKRTSLVKMILSSYSAQLREMTESQTMKQLAKLQVTLHRPLIPQYTATTTTTTTTTTTVTGESTGPVKRKLTPLDQHPILTSPYANKISPSNERLYNYLLSSPPQASPNPLISPPHKSNSDGTSLAHSNGGTLKHPKSPQLHSARQLPEPSLGLEDINTFRQSAFGAFAHFDQNDFGLSLFDMAYLSSPSLHSSIVDIYSKLSLHDHTGNVLERLLVIGDNSRYLLLSKQFPQQHQQCLHYLQSDPYVKSIRNEGQFNALVHASSSSGVTNQTNDANDVDSMMFSSRILSQRVSLVSKIAATHSSMTPPFAILLGSTLIPNSFIPFQFQSDGSISLDYRAKFIGNSLTLMSASTTHPNDFNYYTVCKKSNKSFFHHIADTFSHCIDECTALIDNLYFKKAIPHSPSHLLAPNKPTPPTLLAASQQTPVILSTSSITTTHPPYNTYTQHVIQSSNPLQSPTPSSLFAFGSHLAHAPLSQFNLLYDSTFDTTKHLDRVMLAMKNVLKQFADARRAGFVGHSFSQSECSSTSKLPDNTTVSAWLNAYKFIPFDSITQAYRFSYSTPFESYIPDNRKAFLSVSPSESVNKLPNHQLALSTVFGSQYYDSNPIDPFTIDAMLLLGACPLLTNGYNQTLLEIMLSAHKHCSAAGYARYLATIRIILRQYPTASINSSYPVEGPSTSFATPSVSDLVSTTGLMHRLIKLRPEIQSIPPWYQHHPLLPQQSQQLQHPNLNLVQLSQLLAQFVNVQLSFQHLYLFIPQHLESSIVLTEKTYPSAEIGQTIFRLSKYLCELSPYTYNCAPNDPTPLPLPLLEDQFLKQQQQQQPTTATTTTTTEQIHHLHTQFSLNMGVSPLIVLSNAPHVDSQQHAFGHFAEKCDINAKVCTILVPPALLSNKTPPTPQQCNQYDTALSLLMKHPGNSTSIEKLIKAGATSSLQSYHFQACLPEYQPLFKGSNTIPQHPATVELQPFDTSTHDITNDNINDIIPKTPSGPDIPQNNQQHNISLETPLNLQNQPTSSTTQSPPHSKKQQKQLQDNPTTSELAQRPSSPIPLSNPTNNPQSEVLSSLVRSISKSLSQKISQHQHQQNTDISQNPFENLLLEELQSQVPNVVVAGHDSPAPKTTLTQSIYSKKSASKR